MKEKTSSTSSWTLQERLSSKVNHNAWNARRGPLMNYLKDYVKLVSVKATCDLSSKWTQMYVPRGGFQHRVNLNICKSIMNPESQSNNLNHSKSKMRSSRVKVIHWRLTLSMVIAKLVERYSSSKGIVLYAPFALESFRIRFTLILQVHSEPTRTTTTTTTIKDLNSQDLTSNKEDFDTNCIF